MQLSEMTAQLTLRERALEIAEGRYATAVRKGQELEKELFELKQKAKEHDRGQSPTPTSEGDATPTAPGPHLGTPPLQIPVPAQHPLKQSMMAPTSPPVYLSPVSTPPSAQLGWPQALVHAAPQTTGYHTIYVDLDFCVDHASRVIPLQVRPHSHQL